MRIRLTAIAVAIVAAFALLGGSSGARSPARAAKAPVYDDADLRNRDFSGANLDGASFRNAQLQGANFTRARLRGAVFEQAQLNDAKFIDAQAQGARFSNATMDGVDFTGAQLQGADLNWQLRGLKLARANLAGALFGFGVETELQGADLGGAVLTGVDLGRAQMQGANLKSAILRGVGLADANLQGADLDGADLRGADLSHAHLQGASLRGAKVWHTRGTPEVALADLDGLDLTDAVQLTSREIADVVKLAPMRDEVRKRLALLGVGARPKDLTKADTWTAARPEPKQLAELLARAACGWRKDVDMDAMLDEQADARVTRGLLRNGRLAAVGDQAAIVADALRNGRADKASCPGTAGMTDADWTAIDALAHGK